eukprot:gene27982-biopygen13725
MPSIPPHANVTKLTRENAEVWMLEMYSLLSIYGWEVVIDRGQLQTTMPWLEGATARCVDQSKLLQRTQPVRHRLPPGPSTPTVQRPAQTYWTQQQGLQRDAEAESTACAGQAPGGGGQGGGGARTPVVTRSAGPQLGESSLVGTPLPVSSSATNALSSGEDLDLHQTQTAEVLATLASRHAQHEPSITELEELVTTSNDANLEALRRIEVQVLAFMMLCISPALRYHFAAYAYAQDIWDELLQRVDKVIAATQAMEARRSVVEATLRSPLVDVAVGETAIPQSAPTVTSQDMCRTRAGSYTRTFVRPALARMANLATLREEMLLVGTSPERRPLCIGIRMEVYLLVAVDDHSGWNAVVPMRLKSESAGWIIAIIRNWMGLLLGVAFRCLRTDQAKEFLVPELTNWLASVQAKHEVLSLGKCLMTVSPFSEASSPAVIGEGPPVVVGIEHDAAHLVNGPDAGFHMNLRSRKSAEPIDAGVPAVGLGGDGDNVRHVETPRATAWSTTARSASEGIS